MASNYVTKVAIVGAGGSVGKFITAELVKGGKHSITALTRQGSTNTIPAGVSVKQINYDDPSTIVEALSGIEALIITMAATAPKEQQHKLIEAAASANVAFVFYNSWGIPLEFTQLANETFIGPAHRAAREAIEKLGKSAWIGVTCGFWYEFSLGGAEVRYGFDVPNKTVTLYDEGKVSMNTSTWPQCGRAVANLLSLPLQSENGKPSLNGYKNKSIFISSFKLNQLEMLESVERVTGEKWGVKYQPVKERYAEGLKELQGGDRNGFTKLLYARPFYPDGSGDYEAVFGLDNEALGLPKEDLDAATKVALDNAHRDIAEGRYGLY